MKLNNSNMYFLLENVIILLMREFVTGEWYHLYNRGVEKRQVFLDNEDYERYLFHLFECNNINTLPDLSFKRRAKIISIENSISDKNKNSDNLVEIAVFSLLPNHFHILLKQLKDGGISQFMQKATIAYTKGFNNKYARVGPLFQGSFKYRLIDTDEYFRWLVPYILTNVLDIYQPKWKEKGIDNTQKAKDFLVNYKYSNYMSIVGNHNYNFDFLVQKDSLQDIIGNSKDVELLIDDFLTIENLSEMSEILSEIEFVGNRISDNISDK